MESKANRQLHVFFFPFMAQGHMRPTINLAKLFASKGSKATIITTSYFTSFLSKYIEAKDSGVQIDIVNIRVPTEEVGLPEGVNSVHVTSTPDMQQKFFEACGKLGPQLNQILEQHRPDCLVANMFFPWAPDVGAKFGIPTILFHGTSYFALCAQSSIFLHETHTNVLSDSEPFFIPNFPDHIEITRNKLPEFVRHEDGSHFSKLFKSMRESEFKTYGVLVNSFYELEPAYADHYPKLLGRKAWQVGPLFLYDEDCNSEGHACLKWLDTKRPNSVIYVSFGSIASFNDEQLMEIATGLEASGQQFIWVVKKEKKEEWLPEGFEERMEEKGLILKGWAPQIPILEHKAIGGFVTHCGWNSTLESICAGVPMVTWPVSAEQFYNEKLVTEILRIGIEVGAKKWKRLVGDFVKREAIERAVTRIMEGEEAEEMRSRVKELADKAKSSIKEGGSSVLDLNALFDDLRSARIENGSSST
ncbi:UDP-glucose flavonoid 3-O-glucosyltransferase 7-like [Humulus lupulus]|uniref:UDP-glucose flavonoid 3-O-glucosyltransferase 7-like n=1 Tax=Humulus lupulus TaxID=3486 RepID=UPI002B412498|nr:UDP-glucose flavonoid 3-O-glucosyltransferase 7-like [Humulus lupulus]